MRFFAMLTLFALACGGAPKPSDPAFEATAATDFRLQGIDGRAVRLSDYLGKKVVVLSFWATWCGPCKGELPRLQKMYEQLGEDVVVLGIAMDGPDTIANVPSVARRLGITFPVLLDQETRVVQLYNPTSAAPHNVVFDKRGAVAFVKEGYHAGDEELIEKAVNGLVKGAQ